MSITDQQWVIFIVLNSKPKADKLRLISTAQGKEGSRAAMSKKAATSHMQLLILSYLKLKFSSWATLATPQVFNSHVWLMTTVVESTCPSSWRVSLDNVLLEGLTWALMWEWCRYFYSQVIGQNKSHGSTQTQGS